MASGGDTRFIGRRQILECQVCLLPMTGRNPRSLSCLHTFCEECLNRLLIVEQKEEITCPMCRKTTMAATITALPINTTIERLSRTLHQEGLCYFCIENEGVSNEALFYCKTCRQAMCGPCQETHKIIPTFNEHDVVVTESLFEQKDSLCPVHCKTVDMFCKECDSCLCSICALSPIHRDHVDAFEMIDQTHDRLYINLQDTLAGLWEDIGKEMSKIRNCESQLPEIIGTLKAQIRKWIKKIEEREHTLTKNINSLSELSFQEIKSKIDSTVERVDEVLGKTLKEEFRERDICEQISDLVSYGKICKDLQAEIKALIPGKLPSFASGLGEEITLSFTTGRHEVRPEKQTIKEGTWVRVKRSVQKPRYNWGNVSHESLGIVTDRVGKKVYIDFPEFKGWIGDSDEMETLETQLLKPSH